MPQKDFLLYFKGIHNILVILVPLSLVCKTSFSEQKQLVLRPANVVTSLTADVIYVWTPIASSFWWHWIHRRKNPKSQGSRRKDDHEERISRVFLLPPSLFSVPRMKLSPPLSGMSRCRVLCGLKKRLDMRIWTTSAFFKRRIKQHCISGRRDYKRSQMRRDV